MSPFRMSSMESAIRAVLEYKEAFNRHDVAGIMQLMTDDCILENHHPAPDGALYSGKHAVTEFWQDFFRQSPHAHIEVEEVYGHDFRCFLRWKCDWVDAAGEKGHIRGVDIFKVEKGLIREKMSYVKG